ncbi:hypothetical protein Q5752_002265 [Cryptotrichosporon argae]
MSTTSVGPAADPAATPTTTDTGTGTYNLFPTTTAAAATTTSTSGGGANGASVYYLVVLGVIIVLLLLAGSLTLRAYRIRRRYRTARQRAIARGEPVPLWAADERDDFWAFAGLEMRRRERETGRKRKRVGKVPVLWDAVVGKPEREGREGEDDSDEGGVEDEWGRTQPLTVHSLLAPSAPAPPSESIDVRPTFTTPSRRRGVADPELAPPPAPPSADTPLSEQPPVLARALEPGEPVRVAVVVQMPSEGRGRPRGADDDDEVGWEAGMEIGVWEGVVR